MDATCRHLLRRALSEVMKKIDGEPIFDRHLMRQGAYLLHNVIDEAINSDPTVINALMERLQVPETVATHNQMSDHEKKVAIEAQIEHYSQTPSSLWVWRAPHEILAASIWRCGGEFLSRRVISDTFYEVAREEDLRSPLRGGSKGEATSPTWKSSLADAGLTFWATTSAARD